jgi:hypothetical protein
MSAGWRSIIKPGESFKWKDEELFAAQTRDPCRLGAVRCCMDVVGIGCVAISEDVPSCQQLIFIPRQQYLELKLLGEI